MHGRSRLVPQTTPSSALICAYASSNTAKQQAGWALSGRRSLTGGLVELADQLTWQPRSLPGQQIPCIDMAEPQTNYLIGLSYPAVRRSGSPPPMTPTCALPPPTATSPALATSVRTRARLSPLAGGPHRGPSRTRSFLDLGRLGQDTAMVPAGSTSLTICAPKPHTLTSGYGPSY